MQTLTFAPVDIDRAPLSQVVAGLMTSWVIDGLGLLLLIVVTVLVIRTYVRVRRLERATGQDRASESARHREDGPT